MDTAARSDCPIYFVKSFGSANPDDTAAKEKLMQQATSFI